MASPVSLGTVSARVAATLDSVASDVFGVMGNGNAWFLDAVVTSTALQYTAVRHEAAAVAAADAYYRACGRLAVATTTYGPGFTNAITPLAEAVQARVPLVLVAGAAPHPARAHDIDQRALALSAGAAYFEVARDDAGRITEEAVAFALAERTAVVLAIPYDVADARSTHPDETPAPSALSFARVPLPAVTAAETSAAASLLAGASRPLILAGRGAWLSGAQDAASALAAKLGALTTTSALAMSFFSGDDALGVSGGFATEAT
ncbi:MAG: thiamine pyrophosphate protein central region, partial [Schumannella sp.]|nr:thiamine pyrophosphate protein central region [Schumannella sp.]